MKQMHTHVVPAAIAALVVLGSTIGWAQAPTPPPPQKPIVQVRVDLVLSRYMGDKKTSSMPYSLMVGLNEGGGRQNTSLRMGVDVPVETTTFGPAVKDATATPVTSYSYRNVGTNIDCSGETTDDGAYKLRISISDTSVSESKQSGRPNAPTIQSFSTSTSLMLRSGQSSQFTLATDKVTGEVVKVEVTATAVK